jgi:hypothetical protein
MARIQVKLLVDCYGPSLLGKAGEVVEIDDSEGYSGLAKPYKPPRRKPAKGKGKRKK